MIGIYADFYVESTCGRDVVRCRSKDDGYLTPYEIVCLLNGKDGELHMLRNKVEWLEKRLDLLTSSIEETDRSSDSP